MHVCLLKQKNYVHPFLYSSREEKNVIEESIPMNLR